MKILFYSSKSYDEASFTAANTGDAHEFTFQSARLDEDTAALAVGFPAVCLFVNDRANAPVLEKLAAGGTKLLALRCAGFNQVDLAAAARLGITVVRVPAYSPHAVAEHAVALLLAVVRHIPRAVARVRDGNFELAGLLGFDLHQKTVAIVGTGQIGACFARIMHGFGCQLIAYDPKPNPAVEALGARYLGLPAALAAADVISLHCPLTPQTKHLLNADSLARLRPGAVVINTGRGALIDTRAALTALKSGHLGGLGLDVYEEEEHLFFHDHSHEIITDDVFMRLTTFPNVVITGHQAFFTREALGQIAATTLASVSEFAAGRPCAHAVRPS